ncbi:restriction endonuclease subunit M [Flavobacterium rhamnosiphilum]|uniref:Restriction endonuclease subunit M n=1 Tax=Flavobacterium rhamnosiphilum TaxID=2541724 RepID=A0A4R5F7F2_9FLAO|nr:restriction endonuclease subunit M [Flavobacterium rhamnosiphilum]TDE43815.1 restriction endonuclease subunit M [Flavobacterium rhamnosiphilum]
MQVVIDILENELIEKYPDVLGILLRDQTTQKNIFWATDNYEHLGDSYRFNSEILPDLITGEKGNVIMPRVQKDKTLQLSRSKEMAEVFTPSWICNAQNNLVDNPWFGTEGVFNKEILLKNGTKSWEITKEKIAFPKDKTWEDYVRDTRLEISCGEAPYLVSRYDTTTGEFIKIENRIGILDRKLRVVNENLDSTDEWLKAVETAFKSTYGFEWQGDSLLLAREALLITFIENFTHKFEIEPTLETIQNIAQIISWNIWQMDGLKGIIPNSCKNEILEILDFFETKTEIKKCKGCETQNIKLHNGIYCYIMDWEEKDKETSKAGKVIRFIDLLKK